LLTAIRGMPKPALVIVLVGLLATALAGYIKATGIDTPEANLSWKVTELVAPTEQVGLGPNGRISIERTSASTTLRNPEGVLLFRVAGLVRISHPGGGPVEVTCALESRPPDSRAARTSVARAAWPRANEEIARQVPETANITFDTGERSIVVTPLRDLIGNYTNSSEPTSVRWSGAAGQRQVWIWNLPEGPGGGTASLGFIAVFETAKQPRGSIECRADTADETSTVATSFSVDTGPQSKSSGTASSTD